MITYAMLYTAAVGVPVLLASWAVAAVLRRYGRPERLVWLAGLALAFALPVAGLLRGLSRGAAADAPSAGGASTGVIGLPEILVVPPGAGATGASEVMAALWVAASLLLAVRLTVSALRLARAGRSWRATALDGADVWLTDRVGPAVSGLLRPRILVPTWLAEMPRQQRSLVLLHEQEHIRAGDLWLMLVTRCAPILTPWNPVVWALSSRLLRAIELDCDRRVLRHRPDVGAYGATLIEISSRERGRPFAVAAFAESEAPLRSRILNLTTPSRTVSVVALLASMALGVVLTVAALEIPVPTIRAELALGPAPTGGAAVVAPVREDAETARGRGRADARSEGRAAATGRRASAEEVQARAEEAPPDAAGEIEALRGERSARVAAAGSPELEAAGLAGEDPTESALEPAAAAVVDPTAGPVFTPFTVAPALRNLREVQRALTREYPTVLRDSGIGGTVTVWFFIDEEGRVARTLINESSGYPPLDQAALQVADVYRFSPALNRESPTPVWVALPITFQVR